jgi:CheY-like chemotaxis protein
MDKMLSRIIGEHIHLVTELGPSLGLIRADVGQLEQIIINLAINARDAMPDGGTLTIRTYQTGADGSEFVALEVSDDGAGMSEEIRQRIFEPFFTTKEVGKGTGLGLSTVYGIAHQSGAQITVGSELGRGTDFTILFPRIDDAQGEAPLGSKSLVSDSGTATILLVEDDPGVRRVAARILRERGYSLMECDGPNQARRWCGELGSTIDLLLTDVVMPEVDGVALAEELCSSYPLMRVLYMSGFPRSSAAYEDFVAGNKPFIEKPFTPDTLLDGVRKVLATRSSSE